MMAEVGLVEAVAACVAIALIIAAIAYRERLGAFFGAVVGLAGLLAGLALGRAFKVNQKTEQPPAGGEPNEEAVTYDDDLESILEPEPSEDVGDPDLSSSDPSEWKI